MPQTPKHDHDMTFFMDHQMEQELSIKPSGLFGEIDPSQLMTGLKKREKQNSVLLNDAFSFFSVVHKIS